MCSAAAGYDRRAIFRLLLLITISLSCDRVKCHAVKAPTKPIPSSLTTKPKASLLFAGKISTISEPLPPETTPEELTAFLLRPESRNVFASGGGATNNVQELEITPAWDAMWQKACQKWYGPDNLPSQGDILLSCDTFSHFPGLKVCTTVVSGVKLLLPPQDEHMHVPNKNNRATENRSEILPRYCFLAIGQKQSAQGLPPVVWMFNKLLGIKQEGVDDNDDDAKEGHRLNSDLSSLEPMGPIQNMVSVQQQQRTNEDEDAGAARWYIHLNSDIQIRIEFPAMLLKILPTSKEKAEAQGSASILKTVSKASRLGVEAACSAFVDFQKQERRTK